MSLVLNEEQLLLKESAEGFLAEKAPVSSLRALRDENSEPAFDADVWAETCEMGFGGMIVSEDNGGMGFGYTGAGIMAEAIGRNLSPTPWFASCVMAASVIEALGSDAQRAAWLPAIIDGSKIVAVALDEGGHHDPAGSALKATDGKLCGMKSFVQEGTNADAWLVLAKDGDGHSLYLVEKGAAGVIADQQVMADSRNWARVTLENAEGELVGKAGQAINAITPLLDKARCVVAAELLGLSEYCLTTTVDYLKERKQFGVVIGTFQALQHRAALLFSEIELTRSMVLKALMAADKNDPDLPMLASLAKAKASKTAELATNEGIQMHGGIGMTDELDMGLYMKRARGLQKLLGDYNFHADRFARLRGF